MNLRWKAFAAPVLVLLMAGVPSARGTAAERVTGRLLLKPRDTTPASAVAQMLTALGTKVHHRIDPIGVLVLDVSEPALEAVSEALSKTGMFTFVERDFVAHGGTVPNDPDFASQWHLATIQAASAWSLAEGSSSIPIAIIDSGVDPSHPDLAAKLLPGWNFLTGTSNTADTGANGGHGTFVAGTAAASTNNNTGVAGVAWANTIIPLVVLDSSNYSSYSNIAAAITYAADHGVRIINISLGGSTASSTLQSAVDYAWSKGAVIFAAAMNNSSSAPSYPAACNNVIAVSATDATDTLATFSNYGSWIKLSAPGVNIMTTENGGGYWFCWGTSLATPIAAGVGALALSANPTLSASALVSLLENNSDDLGAPGFDIYYGYGRVNAYKAVAAAKGLKTDTTPPTVAITAPLAGATVMGSVTVQGTASDNVGVTRVEFYVDGVLYSTNASSLVGFSWNSTTYANGTHALMVKAYDAAGNTGSASVSVGLNNPDTTPPKVSIGTPLAGATVSGTLSVTGTASDNVGVTKVEFYVDGALSSSGTAAVFNFSWNSAAQANGSHTLMVKAYDAASNTGSASVGVNVNNVTASLPKLQIHGDSTELSGKTNGSTVTPGTAPAGFTGKVVATGVGSVNFASAQIGNGVYFLNCCSNTNNAYYRFTSAAVGDLFNVNQGQITFYLKSRYSFSQRLTSAASARCTFDVRDGNGNHLFDFQTQIASGELQFVYTVAGATQFYYIPKGTEDTIFGNGVILKVTLAWGSGVSKLYLNGELMKSSSYAIPAPNWTAASNFDLGAYEYLTSGGYRASDDIIDEFTVQ